MAEANVPVSQETEILRQRIDKLNRLRAEENYNPFENEKWTVDHSAAEVEKEFGSLKPQEAVTDRKLSMAGRLMTIRRQGKAAFANLQDETGTIQIYFRYDTLGEKDYNFFKKWLDSGDIIGFTGHPFKTQRGQLTVAVESFRLLTKALRPLPEKWHGLTDLEIRYRKRYLDLIVNAEAREVFRKRARIISTFRAVLEKHGSLEVETPVLSYLAGGANARPFITYHNALGTNMYLRIATELYLKRLVVGMMGRVYELSKDFRNEGMDLTHNPEFTMMEVYWPYSDYEDMMDLTEELIRESCIAANGTALLERDGVVLDFSRPFRRATMVDLVKEHCGIDFTALTDEEARRAARDHNVEIVGNESRFKILTMFVEEFVEQKLIQPTFVMGHPVEISPLSKKDPLNPDYTHRFELFCCGKELSNGYSELNDPIDQKARFIEQAQKKSAGDEESHPYDADFVEALEQGLPPTGGLGIGIDRVVMFLTGCHSIRDVILFPTMKPIGLEKAENRDSSKETYETYDKLTTEEIDLSKVKVEPLFEDMVDFETFSKSDFRVVKVKNCEEVPKSKKLLKFTLDDGSEKERVILSGIKEYYSAESLIGKTLLAICNLPPRKMMGIDSEGMIISAICEYDGEEKLNLIMLDDNIPAGSKLY